MSNPHLARSLLASARAGIAILGTLATLLSAGAATSVSQYGITWTFSQDRTTGQYANGDWWVVGPVTITAITRPQGMADRDGSMIAPATGPQWASQGYDSRSNTPYSASLNIANSLPYTVQPHLTLISSVSRTVTDDGNQIQDIAVLTVVASAPAAGSFRPPVLGQGNKASAWNKSQIDYSKLRNLAPTAGAPSPAALSDLYRRPMVSLYSQYKANNVLGYNNTPIIGKNYGRELTQAAATAGWALNVAASNAEKEALAINFIQHGIDVYGGLTVGLRYMANGGHQSGRKLPMLMAGILLNDSNIVSMASGSATRPMKFAEDQQHFRVTQYDVDLPRGTSTEARPVLPYTTSMIGMPEWGPDYESDAKGSGSNWGRIYRDVVGQNHPGVALVCHVMGIADEWNHDPFFDYNDRVMGKLTNSGWEPATIFPGVPTWVRTAWAAYREGDSDATARVSEPVANPDGGNYSGPQTVTLSSPTVGATIHYTLDGSTPTTASPAYNGTLPISQALTLKAIAVKTGMTDSSVLAASYSFSDYASSSTWQSVALNPAQTGSFTVSWVATPSSSAIDSVTGLATAQAAAYSELACIIRFNDEGYIDARNGSAYAAVNALSYSAGTEYAIQVAVNLASKTYDVTVTPQNGSAVVIADDYAFRSEQAAVTQLAFISLYAASGSHAMSQITLGGSSGAVPLAPQDLSLTSPP